MLLMFSPFLVCKLIEKIASSDVKINDTSVLGEILLIYTNWCLGVKVHL